ncbi:hypothetical protein BSNT_08714 [Bacillus subtilis subsp. natto BEST195]|nr:hypothetical protein BSNT_08714 [Bacillus subtilis subsp. natto BEST195]
MLAIKKTPAQSAGVSYGTRFFGKFRLDFTVLSEYKK